MKKLLIIVFALSSISAFSQDQEKKGICASNIQLFHDNGGDWNSNDHFYLDGFYLTSFSYYGSFINATTSSDSVTFEITLPFGDSLLYSAYWKADGICNTLDSADVNSLISVLEGIPFPITHHGYYGTNFYYDISQKGVITSPCFFKILKEDIPHRPYFIRVKYMDPPEEPLALPEIINDISLWLSSENTLAVKADEEVVWDLNLYSLSGQMIQTSKMNGSQSLDISNLSKGCYVAHISSENGLKKQMKFIR